ncbi:DUF4157 domain-containing protein [Actinomycetospora chibensis]|uniref:DUF4157 domain-containing protein n=1 Tax=Actinomycetospora chibensis TaxID=663606 RepID=A0ABV9RPH9_9PSEU|nr:DUF4157 domain-containing protein [Actinomycetospora chibensis]MDD7926964.1 DUF4157 domain-containing protein [Actinomycetospora chibensis]
MTVAEPGEPRAGARKMVATPGRPLEESVRRVAEAHFGADFDAVRVHTDALAAKSADALGADAYTVGHHIAFGDGKYTPVSPGGRRLLMHELAHVAQQPAVDPTAVERMPVAMPHAAAERAADHAVAVPGAPTVVSPPAIHRQPKERPKLTFELNVFGIEGTPQTNANLVAFARFVAGTLESDLDDVESVELRARARNWLDTTAKALPYFEQHAAEPIDDAMVPLINHQAEQLVAIREAIREEQVERLRAALVAEQRAAEKAAAAAEALQPRLDDALRVAYRMGDSSAVKTAVSTVKTGLSAARNLNTLARDITTDIFKLPLPKGTTMSIDRWSSQIGRVKVTIVNVGKYTDMLTKLNRGLAVINIALTIADRRKRATDVEQGMKDLEDVVGIATDLATLSPVSLPPHMSLMSTLWIKPALKVISKQIGVLVEQLGEVNRISVEVTGNLMYPGAEPGGQEMFDVMVAVMRASTASEVPPIRDRVAEYLYDHRDKLEAGAEEAVPTSGWWFWEALDSDRSRAWLFTHRRRIWAMFYGSMAVPERRSR